MINLIIRTPSKLICSGFSASIATTGTLSFTFLITNPTVTTTHMHIPITIYT
jgi:hypothetical protein